mgnify:CR=1 FL=1
MYIILEGIDRTGKTTLQKEIFKFYENLHCTIYFDKIINIAEPEIIGVKPKDLSEDFTRGFYSGMTEMKKNIINSTQHYLGIMSRYHISEIVFSIYGKRTKIENSDLLFEYYEKVLSKSDIIILCKSTYNTHVSRCVEKSDNYFNKEDFNYLVNMYEAFTKLSKCKILEYNSDNFLGCPENFIKEYTEVFTSGITYN